MFPKKGGIAVRLVLEAFGSVERDMKDRSTKTLKIFSHFVLDTNYLSFLSSSNQLEDMFKR